MGWGGVHSVIILLYYTIRRLYNLLFLRSLSVQTETNIFKISSAKGIRIVDTRILNVKMHIYRHIVGKS